MTEPGKRAFSLPKRTLHSSLGVAPASAPVVPGCSRRTACRVGIAARNPDKPVLQNLEKTHGVRRYACDASEPAAVELLFENVVRDLGAPTLVVHNIDGRVPGIFRQGDCRSRPKHGVRHTSKLGVQRVLGGSAGSPAHARKQTERKRRQGNDHLHERKRSAQRLPIERRLCNGMPCQVRTGAKHGEGTDAARHPRSKCAD